MGGKVSANKIPSSRIWCGLFGDWKRRLSKVGAIRYLKNIKKVCILTGR